MSLVNRSQSEKKASDIYKDKYNIRIFIKNVGLFTIYIVNSEGHI